MRGQQGINPGLRSKPAGVPPDRIRGLGSQLRALPPGRAALLALRARASGACPPDPDERGRARGAQPGAQAPGARGDGARHGVSVDGVGAETGRERERGAALAQLDERTEERMSIVEQAEGRGWVAYNGDCVPIFRALPAESVGFSVYSPPFA